MEENRKFDYTPRLGLAGGLPAGDSEDYGYSVLRFNGMINVKRRGEPIFSAPESKFVRVLDDMLDKDKIGPFGHEEVLRLYNRFNI